MKNKNRFRLCPIVGLMLASVLFSEGRAQSFGKNKVQYKDFQWKYLQSEHFDIYYYEDENLLADFSADVAESCYVKLSKDLRYEIHERIPVLIYTSHNDFEQTNVTSYLIEETIGGFTEIFKNRVVVPFQGNYSEFRHVLHHELTHAVMFQMMYGNAMGSMVTSMARFQLPLWLTEGLAEYESLGWDADSDMLMRDATMNGYVPPIVMMNGYMAYKGGQALLHYIAEKYGSPKIGEIFGKVRVNRNVEQGFKQAIGVGLDELTKRWHKHLRKTYWPDIEDREEPADLGKRLTDHEKERTFLNNSPSLSPRGDKMVFLSSRSDYIDIYLMNVLEGKLAGRLIQGERSSLFEELHWLRPGITWSPDGKRIAFTAKSGNQDAIYILDLETRQVIDSYRFDLNGLFSPSWSPKGHEIVFMAMDKSRSDLFVLNLGDRSIRRLTDDEFSDLDPSWSPDGREVVFVSDRGEYFSQPEEGLKIQNHDFDRFDLYSINADSGTMVRYTNDPAKEMSPVFSPSGDQIAFVSDKNGINNIYILDRRSTSVYPITNLLSGVSQITWSREGSRLAFSSFFEGGYDIYLMNNPMDIKPGSVVVQNTEYQEIREKEWDRQSLIFGIADSRIPADGQPSEKDHRVSPDGGYRSFVFDDAFGRGDIQKSEKKSKVFFDSSITKNESGEYKTKKYKIRFSPDLVMGEAGYSQFYGLQGTSMIGLSDILGNHQINIYTDIFYNLKNSNFQLSYYYLTKRTDIGIALFHYSYLYYITFYSDGYPMWGYIRDRNYGATFFASRPFDRYRRIDFGITGMGIDRDYGEIDPYGYYYGGSGDFMEDLGNLYRRRILLLNLGYNTDTVIWGMTGPVNGSRSTLTLTYSPTVSKKYGLDFFTIRGDSRKYLKISRDYTLAIRISGGFSGGASPQRFLLGGMPGWINYQYHEIADRYWGNDLFYFSTFETPLRGSRYYEMIGTRFLLANVEFRFPMIQYLILGWPLPLGFQDIRGAIFFDMGSAWDNDRSWKPFVKNSVVFPKLNDMKAGFGFGMRMNLGFFLLKYDLAWQTNLAVTDKKPIHYFTLGAEF